MGLRRAGHVAWRRVSGETVLLHLKTKSIYVLNESGGFFWHRIDGASGSKEMLDALDLEEPLPEDAEDRVESFLTELREKDLLEEGDPTEGDGNLPGYSLQSFVPPELVWREQLRNFGQSCVTNPGESDPCNTTPTF